MEREQSVEMISDVEKKRKGVHIIVDSGASEQVLIDELYIMDVKHRQLRTVWLVNSITVSTDRQGHLNIQIGWRKPSLCRAYLIPEIKLNS